MARDGEENMSEWQGVVEIQRDMSRDDDLFAIVRSRSKVYWHVRPELIYPRKCPSVPLLLRRGSALRSILRAIEVRWLCIRLTSHSILADNNIPRDSVTNMKAAAAPT